LEEGVGATQESAAGWRGTQGKGINEVVGKKKN